MSCDPSLKVTIGDMTYCMGTKKPCTDHETCDPTGEVCFGLSENSSGYCRCVGGYALDGDSKICSLQMPCSPNSQFGTCPSGTYCLGGQCIKPGCPTGYNYLCHQCTDQSYNASIDLDAMERPLPVPTTDFRAASPLSIVGTACSTNTDCGICFLYCDADSKTCQSSPLTCQENQKPCPTTLCPNASENWVFADGKWTCQPNVTCSPNSPCSNRVAPGTPNYDPNFASLWYCQAGVPECSHFGIDCTPGGVNPCQPSHQYPSFHCTTGTCNPQTFKCHSPPSVTCKTYNSNCGTINGQKCGPWNGACPTGMHCVEGQQANTCRSDVSGGFDAKGFLRWMMPSMACPTSLNYQAADNAFNPCYVNTNLYDLTTPNGILRRPAHSQFIPHIAQSMPVSFDNNAISPSHTSQTSVVPGNYGNTSNQTNLQVLFAYDDASLATMNPQVCGADPSASICADLGGGLACEPGTSPVNVFDEWYLVPNGVKDKYPKETLPSYFSVWACKYRPEACPQGWNKAIVNVGSATSPKFIYGCRRTSLPAYGAACYNKQIPDTCHTGTCRGTLGGTFYENHCNFKGGSSVQCGRYSIEDTLLADSPIPSGFIYPQATKDGSTINYAKCSNKHGCLGTEAQTWFRAADDAPTVGDVHPYMWYASDGEW